MSGPFIACPNCGTEFELTEALAAPLQAEIAAAHEAELARTREKLRCESEAHVNALVREAEQKAREDASLQRQILQRELNDERERRAAAQAAELSLRQE